jgi:subfamily B ATP-binding cassette protein HlyB/CyaB
LTTSPLPETAAQLTQLFSEQGEVRHYPIGAVLLEPHEPVPGVWWIEQGSVRSLAALPPQGDWRTVDRYGPGSLVGWLGLLHQQPFEHLRVAEPLQARFLPADRFEQLWRSQPALRAWCAAQTPPIEALQLLLRLAQANPSRSLQLQQWQKLLPQLHWWVADVSDAALDAVPPGPELSGQWWSPLDAADQAWQRRLIWLPAEPLPEASDLVKAEIAALATAEPVRPSVDGQPPKLMLRPAAGPHDIPLALCQGLASWFGVPFNRDALNDQIDATLKRQSQLNLINLGQMLSGMTLSVALSEVPGGQLHRVPTPAVIDHRGRLALLEGLDSDGLVRLLEPELGPIRVPLQDLLAEGETSIELLLLRRRPDSKEARFGWGWFAPYLREHRRELIEVLAVSAMVNVLALATPLGFQRLIDSKTGGSDSLNGLISIGIILLLASVVKAISNALRSLIFTGVANRVDIDTKEAILDRLVRLPQGFFDTRPVGQITFYFSQLDRLREFLIGQALTTLLDTSFSVLYIAVLLAINPLLTFVTISTLPLFIVLAFVANPLIEHQISRTVSEGVSTNSYLTEAITGIQTIKSQNAELKTRWEFYRRYSRYIGEDYKLRISGETINALASFISDLNQLLVIGVGIYLVMQDQLSLGGLIAFRIIGGYITGPLVKLVQTWQQFKQASQSLQLVGDVVDRQTEQSELQATNIPMPPLRGHVQIQKVSFRYSPETPEILHNVSLNVPVGTFVGMVGGSGSGKSTLLKLLPRFYEPVQGCVLIDDLDIAKTELYSLRRQIGVVPQDSLLFDGTIKDNLLLVKPDASAEELIRSCKIACAHDFIMGMPQGYNSSVGERGAGLSGGQRQRMALARAVLQNPRMLILDEATSALDARTERQVCLNLFDAFRGRTVFFITHRLSTVRPADCIVLMDQGAIMEVGNHQQLMQRRGWYYALYQSQNQEGLS